MRIDAEWGGEKLSLETGEGLFSPGGLDAGTRQMLNCAEFSPGKKVLDLGCGYGAVGLLAARKCGEECVWMTDVDREAVRVASENARDNGLAGVHIQQSDGFRALDEAGFDLILSNPPYHADFAVAKHFIEKGFNRLVIGGTLLMVTKRRDWYKNKLIAIFGGVKIVESEGYFVFLAERRSSRYAGGKKK